MKDKNEKDRVRLVLLPGGSRFVKVAFWPKTVKKPVKKK